MDHFAEEIKLRLQDFIKVSARYLNIEIPSPAAFKLEEKNCVLNLQIANCSQRFCVQLRAVALSFQICNSLELSTHQCSVLDPELIVIVSQCTDRNDYFAN